MRRRALVVAHLGAVAVGREQFLYLVGRQPDILRQPRRAVDGPIARSSRVKPEANAATRERLEAA